MEKDEKLIELENLFVQSLIAIDQNRHTGKIGSLIGLFKGDAKRLINASRLNKNTIHNIISHCVLILKVPTVAEYVNYWMNELFPLYRKVFPLAPKSNEVKMTKLINKLLAKGILSGFSIDNNGNFIIK